MVKRWSLEVKVILILTIATRKSYYMIITSGIKMDWNTMSLSILWIFPSSQLNSDIKNCSRDNLMGMHSLILAVKKEEDDGIVSVLLVDKIKFCKKKKREPWKRENLVSRVICLLHVLALRVKYHAPYSDFSSKLLFQQVAAPRVVHFEACLPVLSLTFLIPTYNILRCFC